MNNTSSSKSPINFKCYGLITKPPVSHGSLGHRNKVAFQPSAINLSLISFTALSVSGLSTACYQTNIYSSGETSTRSAVNILYIADGGGVTVTLVSRDYW